MAQGSIRVRCKVCRQLNQQEEGACKHKERTFNARFPRPGGGEESGTFQTKGEAEIFLADKRLEYHRNPEYRKQKNITFSELADVWLTSKERTISPRSWTNCKLIVQNHLKPALGHINVNAIRPALVQEVRNKAARQGFWTASKVNWMMKGIFKTAIINGFISKDPCIGFGRLKNSRPTHYIVLNQEKVQSLIDAPTGYVNKYDTKKNIAWRHKTLPLIYRLALFTGIRPAENFGITRDCIDFNKKSLTINKTIVWFNNDKERELAGVGEDGQWQFRPPKSRAGNRILPLGDELIKALQIYLIEMPENPHSLLFVGANGVPLREGVFMKNYFNDDVKRAGCPKMRFYDLRHTYCSMFVQKFGHLPNALQELQYRMGHEKLTTTLDIYTHFMNIYHKPNDAFANQMESFVFKQNEAHIRD